jgi:ssDNA-binding replication factor A large subunit
LVIFLSFPQQKATIQLLDNSEEPIEVVGWENNRKFVDENGLKEGSSYRISHVKVFGSNAKHSTVKHKYELRVMPDTTFTRIDDVQEIFPPTITF